MAMMRVIGVMFCAAGLLACTERTQQNTLVEPAIEPEVSKADTTGVKAVEAWNDRKNVKLTYTAIEWTDLMPKEDLDALLNPPEYLQDIEDGSDADALEDQIKSKTPTKVDDRYQRALVSKIIMPEFNNRAIRLPGFIVPLAFNEEQGVTHFFLVPYFGACLHMPPPPPNQIIYAQYPPGVTLEAFYDPFWIEGTLTTTLMENDTATAAYSITVDSVDLYTEDD